MRLAGCLVLTPVQRPCYCHTSALVSFVYGIFYWYSDTYLPETTWRIACRKNRNHHMMNLSYAVNYQIIWTMRSTSAIARYLCLFYSLGSSFSYFLIDNLVYMMKLQRNYRALKVETRSSRMTQTTDAQGPDGTYSKVLIKIHGQLCKVFFSYASCSCSVSFQCILIGIRIHFAYLR